MLRYSLAYPTRDRPEMVSWLLKFLEAQQHDNFEVIILDNPSSPEYSVKDICDQSSVANLTYVAAEDLSMIQNWNRATRHYKGQYLSVMTDKTFMLPGTLSKIDYLLERRDSDIISWNAATLTPIDLQNYTGPATLRTQGGELRMDLIQSISPTDVFRDLLAAQTPRERQPPSTYTAGKICFGLYRRDLIDKINETSGALFHPISPDYTSRALALLNGTMLTLTNFDAVVQINTLLSNGLKVSESIEYADAFVRSVDGVRSLEENAIVPKWSGSVHNLVSADYQWALSTHSSHAKGLELNRSQWLSHIVDDFENLKEPDLEHNAWREGYNNLRIAVIPFPELHLRIDQFAFGRTSPTEVLPRATRYRMVLRRLIMASDLRPARILIHAIYRLRYRRRFYHSIGSFLKRSMP